MLGASNTTHIFLTFLTDKKKKKLCKITPVKIKAGFVSYWQQCHRKRGLSLFSSIDKSQRSAKFSSFSLTVGKELQERAQVSEGWSTYKTCIGQTCSCWAVLWAGKEGHHPSSRAPGSSWSSAICRGGCPRPGAPCQGRWCGCALAGVKLQTWAVLASCIARVATPRAAAFWPSWWICAGQGYVALGW